jgi:hypothetical protein
MFRLVKAMETQVQNVGGDATSEKPLQEKLGELLAAARRHRVARERWRRMLEASRAALPA